MLLSKKETNKLVGYVDRYFTYDWRYIQAEGKTPTHIVSKFALFTGRNCSTDVYVSIDKGAYGIYVCIIKAGSVLYSGYLESFKEVRVFKAMIRCLG